LLSAIDIGILGILGLFLIKGAIRGLLKEVCSLLGLVLGGVFAFTFHVPLAQALQDTFGFPAQLCVWGSFVAIFLLVTIVFSVVGFLLHRFIRLVFLGGFNRMAGAVFGTVQGVVLLSMIVLALNSSVVPKSARRMMGDSQLAPPFEQLGQSIFLGSKELMGR
jgi:membrane protein required for colicin V production